MHSVSVSLDFLLKLHAYLLSPPPLVIRNSLFSCFDTMLTDVVRVQWVTSNSRFLMGSRRTITPLIGRFRLRSQRPDSSDAFLQTCAAFAAPFISIGACNRNYWLLFTVSKCFLLKNLDRGIDERRDCDGGVVNWVISHHHGRQSPAWPGLNVLLKELLNCSLTLSFLIQKDNNGGTRHHNPRKTGPQKVFIYVYTQRFFSLC